MTFIHEVMGIPALHRLVTVNMIPDAANDNLKAGNQQLTLTLTRL